MTPSGSAPQGMETFVRFPRALSDDLPQAPMSATAFHDQLRKSPGLSDAAVRLALILSGYADATGRCWPSQRRVAHELDWSLRKVERTMGELQAAGLVVYLERARHRGERSIIQLRTTVTSGTAVVSDGGYQEGTADKTNREPPSHLTRTTVTDDGQNSPMNSPIELPQFLTGTESSVPGGTVEVFTSQKAVAHAVAVASDHGLTPPSSRWKGQLGKMAKERLAAGADPGNMLLAVERLLVESKSPANLEAVLRDIEGGARHHGGPRTHHADDGRVGDDGGW